MAGEEIGRFGSFRSYTYNLYAQGDIINSQIGEGNTHESGDIDYHDELLELKDDFYELKNVVEDKHEALTERVQKLEENVQKLSLRQEIQEQAFTKVIEIKDNVIRSKDETIKAHEETIRAQEEAIKAKDRAIKASRQINDRWPFPLGMFNFLKEKKKNQKEKVSVTRERVKEQGRVEIKIYQGYRLRPRYMETYQGSLLVYKHISLDMLEEKIRSEYKKLKVKVTRIERGGIGGIYNIMDKMKSTALVNGDEVYLWWE